MPSSAAVITWKWRCGVDENPVFPDSPSSWPRATAWPGRTSMPLGANLDKELAAQKPLLEIAHERNIPVIFSTVIYNDHDLKDAGLWAPHLPPEAGGSGSGFLEYADLNEEIGRSFIAQLIFGCQAPDAGNAEILHLYGTDEQKEQFLRPLVAGEVRSFFGMTEPEVAGSDPTLLRGRAERADRDLDTVRAELARTRQETGTAEAPAGSRRRRSGQPPE